MILTNLNGTTSSKIWSCSICCRDHSKNYRYSTTDGAWFSFIPCTVTDINYIPKVFADKKRKNINQKNPHTVHLDIKLLTKNLETQEGKKMLRFGLSRTSTSCRPFTSISFLLCTNHLTLFYFSFSSKREKETAGFAHPAEWAKVF